MTGLNVHGPGSSPDLPLLEFYSSDAGFPCLHKQLFPPARRCGLSSCASHFHTVLVQVRYCVRVPGNTLGSSALLSSLYHVSWMIPDWKFFFLVIDHLKGVVKWFLEQRSCRKSELHNNNGFFFFLTEFLNVSVDNFVNCFTISKEYNAEYDW